MRHTLLWITACAGCVSSLIMLLSVGVMTPFQGAVSWVSQGTRSASVFFVQSITVAQIQSNYHGVQFGDSVSTPSPVPTPSEKKVRILVVPGHQPERGGTEFNGVYERDIVVDIADTLAELISQNRHYDVMVSRTKTRWHPILQKYFDTSVLEIETFRQSLALQMEKYLALGSILPEADQVYHNTTSSEASLQLYGINKWASDNKYDIILHLHLNDYAGRRARAVGQHDGFTIYVPDNQYSNAVASKSVAEAIAVRLSAYHATSTLPKEDKGVVEDQELIAIGSNNSVDGAALLIEYGYIYEPQFRNPSIRSVAVADYAYQTYLGLQDFFKDPLSPTFGSISFPYEWSAINAGDGVSGPGIYALQSALRYLGYYPPAGRRFSDCPISGVVGPCTRSAIAAYQHAHGLTVTGTLGPKTRAELESDLSAP